MTRLSGRMLALPNLASGTRPALAPAAESDRLTEMVSANFRAVWRFIRRLGVPECDVDDGVQEVIVIAARKLDAIEPGSERAFMMATAYRVAAAMRRARSARSELPDAELDELSSAAPSPEDLALQKAERAALDRVLDHMPLELRAVFVLYEVEGLTMAEIAELLTLARGTVASRLRRARADFEARVDRLALAMKRGGAA